MVEYDEKIYKYKSIEGYCALDSHNELPICMDYIYIWGEEKIYRKKKSANCNCNVEEYLQKVSEKKPKCIQCKQNLSDCEIIIDGEEYPCQICQANNYAYTNDVKQNVKKQIGECPICYEEKQISRFCQNNHYFCDECISGEYENYQVTEEDKPIFPYEEEIKQKYIKFLNDGKYLTEEGLIDLDQDYQQKLKKKDLNSNSDVYIESEEPEYFGKVFNRDYDTDDDDGFSFKFIIGNNEEEKTQAEEWTNKMISDYLNNYFEWKSKKEGIEQKTIIEPILDCPLCRKSFIEF